jgi:hypothetical protein
MLVDRAIATSRLGFRGLFVTRLHGDHTDARLLLSPAPSLVGGMKPTASRKGIGVGCDDATALV